MRRFVLSVLFVLLLAVPVLFIAAQDIPAATPEPSSIELPPGAVPIPTAVGGDPAPAAAPAAAGLVFPADVVALLASVRTDMELLAAQMLGGERPLGWNGTLNVSDPQVLLLARLDLELLAGTLLGPNVRPPGWFGAVPSTPFAIARDVRHDLELLADAVGQPNVRPLGWAGSDPLMRCDRTVQALIFLLERSGVFQLTADVSAPDFCQQASIQASQYLETAPNPLPGAPSASAAPVEAVSAAPAAPATAPSVQISSPVAVAFLNRTATEMVGTVPLGSTVTPVGRSYVAFSRMVLVRGEGFEVFLDYQNTTLTEAQFATLPDVNTLTASPVCAADWCKATIGTLGSPAAGRTDPSQP